MIGTGHTGHEGLASAFVQLAYDGIFSLSDAPVRIARNFGLVVTASAAVLAAWTLFKRLIFYEVVPGFATLTILVLFFGGVQLVTIGVVGEYIARIYAEVKRRPLYVVKAVDGLEPRSRNAGLDGEAPS